MRYTGAPVVEPVEETAEEFVPAWLPVVGNKVVAIEKEGGKEYEFELVDGKLPITAGRFSKIRYTYDNVKIPQADLPIVNVEMANLPLVAKARRVAIYYSQIAAFQAKTDYGFDMGKELAEKACAELAFEIDEEIIHFLADMGRKEDNQIADAVFNKTLPVGVNY